MRVFVFEFVTGGGWPVACHDSPPGGLSREGQAMRRAVIADLIAAGHEVDFTSDFRFPWGDCIGARETVIDANSAWPDVFQRMAANADWTLVIAPETAGWLELYVGLANQAGGRALAPPLSTIRLAADKHLTAEHLRAKQIPAPRGFLVEAATEVPRELCYALPAVLKPRDGAGSEGIRWIRSNYDLDESSVAQRLEEFVRGRAASIAFLCGPKSFYPLAPCLQVLDNAMPINSMPGIRPFHYLGGECPLSNDLAARAITLASRAVALLERPLGYIGVDLVLGYGDASDDRVIEINPRLTTSYVGLRTLFRGNLAETMLRIAEGESVEIAFNDGPVRFLADGSITFARRV